MTNYLVGPNMSFENSYRSRSFQLGCGGHIGVWIAVRCQIRNGPTFDLSAGAADPLALAVFKSPR